MLDQVVKGFLAREVKAVPHVGGERQFGHLDRDVPATPDLGLAEIVLGEFAEIGQETLERIIARVDGLDDFVHGPGQRAGAGGNLTHHLLVGGSRLDGLVQAVA